ncbi:MAG: hypothetical protein PHF11_01280 [Candidatus Omnitrophica bacterium]|nr:hypothetical protein [Candidatus Omnitrophota bacterium]
MITDVNLLIAFWCIRVIPGLFWTLAYILIIKRGYQDKTYGMPLVAACANLSWEFIFSFVYPQCPAKLYFNIPWFLLDAVILFQIVKYGRSVANQAILKRFFHPILILTAAISFSAILFITYELKDWRGVYSGYTQNCMMSLLFIFMLLKRNNIGGQSIYIAFLKMAGSFAAFSPYLLFRFSPFFSLLGGATFILDWTYIFLLYAKHKKLKINPWIRF